MLAVGFDRSRIQTTLERWLKVRARLTTEPLRTDPSRIVEFWKLVSLAYNKEDSSGQGHHSSDGRIVRFLAEMLEGVKDAEPASWELLVGGLGKARLALNDMHLSREERVRAMDEVMSDVVSAHEVDVKIREVVLGYLASRVANGSLAYTSLLEPVEPSLPMALMWFGLFASLQKDSDALISGECLGRRIVRDIQRRANIFGIPDADVSFEEFDALVSGARSDIKIRRQHQSLIAVEIAPSITAVFRVAPDVRPEMEPHPPSITPEASRELRHLLQRIASMIDRLSEPQQRELFSGKAGAKRPTSTRSKRTTR